MGLTIDEQIRRKLQIEKIRKFKNPAILINTDDFNFFKSELEKDIVNYKVGKTPKYMDIPIIVKDHIQRGSVIIYDKPIDINTLK
jgi:hypothetical protein